VATGEIALHNSWQADLTEPRWLTDAEKQGILGMRTRGIAAVLVLGLAIAACSKKNDQAATAEDASPAAVNAAADASSVTSIPGYAPEAGNAPASPKPPAGNAR
jgi:hypothetical protein